jgi:chitinase
MEAGTGEEWIIRFHTQLRSRLPTHIISHCPQAPYFKSEAYKNGAYSTIHNKIGSTIDFYNTQFYNQGDTKYDTYEELFIKATGFFSGTSVQELINRGIPAKKIVVGKPAALVDVMNTGYVTP